MNCSAIAAALMLTAWTCINPAAACSGYPPAVLASKADVIVSGRVSDQTLVARRVIKGPKLARYDVKWPAVDDKDECRFLGPITRETGVFFLQRDADGKYLIFWTEKRWK